MNKKNLTVGIFLIISAIIWAAVIIGCAYKLKGTDGYDLIQPVLTGGMIGHFALFLSLWAIQFKKKDID